MPSRPWSRTHHAALLLAFAIVYGAAQWATVTRASATFDEPGSLLAGYAALAHGDYRPALEHPPLARLWTALPLVFTPGVRWDPGELDGMAPAAVAFPGPFAAGQRFLYGTPDADAVLVRARVMTVLLAIALGGLVYLWVCEWLGARTALIALAAFALEPNLAAHGALATNDLAVTAFMTGAVYALWRLARRWSPAGVVLVAVCVAAAVLSKFSAILLGPILLVLLAVAARRSDQITWRRSTALLAAALGVTWLAIWAAYGFRYEPSATPGWRFDIDQLPMVRQTVPALADLVGRIDDWRLLPNAFSQGFLHGQGLVQSRPAFLLGQYRTEGWWYYFPIAWALKTPLALAALALSGGVLAARRRLPLPGGVVWLVAPVAIFGGVAMLAPVNIGLRHILPIFPFVIVLAAAAGEAVIARLGVRTGAAVLSAAAVLTVAEVARAWPGTLAFFNTAAGGPAAGYRYLADSNIDWGQDLKGLRVWMRSAGVDHINLAYFGVADPDHDGMNYTPIWGTTLPDVPPERLGPPRLPGYVAISVTLLNGVPFPEGQRQFYAPLRSREPAADIGGSIKVYWVEQPWW